MSRANQDQKNLEIHILCTAPRLLEPFQEVGVIKEAFRSHRVQWNTLNLFDFAEGKYGSIDDRPFGGGEGMVIKASVVERALDTIPDWEKKKRVYLSPQGKVWDQSMARSWIKTHSQIILLCGRYRGVDQRAIDHFGFEEISIGNYILSGGELAALVILDSIIRLLPGILGNPNSLEQDSFPPRSPFLLEAPVYTRPAVWKDLEVPEVLLSGNHEAIRKWKEQKSLEVTKIKRPDLWSQFENQKKPKQ